MKSNGFVRLLGAMSLLVLLALPYGALPTFAATGPTPQPTPPVPSTPTVSGTCDPASRSGCPGALLKLLNQHRARYGIPGLTLLGVQSTGRAGCPGAYGHSTAMARSGFIWHINPHYPRASFPNNICVRFTSVGENVGDASTGAELQDLGMLDQEMMSEPHSRSTCATAVSHACNILNPGFRHVGIGIYVAQGYTWLTEDFTN